jgi:O-antigen/teichoic acid export membrane protein
VNLKSSLYEVLPDFARRYADRIEASPLASRLARGAFWLTLGAILSRGLAVAASVVTARLLGKAAFGELGMVIATLGLVSFVGGLGLGTTATKYVATWRSSDPARAGRIIGLSITVSAVAGLALLAATIVGADYLAAQTLNAPHLAPYIRMGSPLLLVGTMTGVIGGALAGLESFRRLTIVSVIVGVAAFPITVGGVILAGFRGAVLAVVVVALINIVLVQAVGHREYDRWQIAVSFRGIWQERHALWAFSVPSFLCALLFIGAPWVACAILIHTPRGYEELGAFNAANQWRNLALFAPAAAANVTLPVLTELFSAGDSTRYDRVLKANLWANLAVALAVAVPVVALGKWVMMLYGKDFAGAGPVVALLCVTAVFQAASNVVGYAIASGGRMWVGFLFNLFWAVALVSLATVLTPRWGAVGLAAATLFAYVVFTTLIGLYARKMEVPEAKKDSSAAAPSTQDRKAAKAGVVASTGDSAT